MAELVLLKEPVPQSVHVAPVTYCPAGQLGVVGEGVGTGVGEGVGAAVGEGVGE
jgi:putative ATP-grasp target RiPP